MTDGEKVTTATLCAPLAPPTPLPVDPLRPEPWASKAMSRNLRLIPLAPVTSASIGRPIVIQRTATSGKATSIGKARERALRALREPGSRFGRLM